MKTLLARITFLAVLIAAAVLAGLAPAITADGFQSCPSPPCMAPCAHPPQPQVECRSAEGEPFVTSFACCCCGGGGSSNEFRWLDRK